MLPAAPIPGRADHLAVWTGSEMIVWGGGAGGPTNTDGAAYDPAANRWRRIADAPTAFLFYPRAVWTGTEMIVWGERNPTVRPDRQGSSASTLGEAYSPATDSWRSLPDAPIGPRVGFSLVWTGTEMTVFGGHDDCGYCGRGPGVMAGNRDGAAYDPHANRWRSIGPAPLGPIGGPDGPGSVWDGHELIVWGGMIAVSDVSEPPTAEGAALDPTTGRWRPLPKGPVASMFPDGAWTGTVVLSFVWAPKGMAVAASDLVAYSPERDSWYQLPPSGLAPRPSPPTVWTGRQLIIWGGGNDGVAHDDGAVFTVDGGPAAAPVTAPTTSGPAEQRSIAPTGVPECPPDTSMPSMGSGSFCGPEPHAGNGNGPDGLCVGSEKSPPCAAGVTVGHYYSYTLPGTCDGRILFDGRRWISELPPPTNGPDMYVWMRLDSTGGLGFISPRGSVGFQPDAGKPPLPCRE